MPASITLTVSHLPTSTSFFLTALQPLGYCFRGRQEQTVGFGPEASPTSPADFWITQEIPGVPAGAAHVAFPAATRTQVQQFFVAALKAGGKIHGEPAQRDTSGYYSAAVIDFDGNSIEAVYRPPLLSGENKENEDAASTVSRKSNATRSVKVPPTTVSRAKTVVSTKAPTVVSARAPTVVSKAVSIAPSQVQSVVARTHVSNTATQQPQQSEAPDPKPRTQGDVLDTLINEARNAANVARDLVNSVRPNLTSSASSPAAPGLGLGINTDHAAGGAIVGTLIGVAAGAALHYAFSNRSKENHEPDPPKSEPQRPGLNDRALTAPDVLRPDYSSMGGASAVHYETTRVYHTIEPAPSTYTYDVERHYDQPRLITMHDNDPPRSEYASTIKAPTASHVSRRKSIDSGFGPGPRDIEVMSAAASSKASRTSKKSSKPLDAPPTSYRAPTVLTTVETQMSKRSGSRTRSKSRSGSVSRVLSSVTGRGRAATAIIDDDDDEYEEKKGSVSGSKHSKVSRVRSQSRHTDQSRRSRRDDFDDGKDNNGDQEARTVLHINSSSSALSKSKSQTHSNHHSHVSSYHSAAKRAPSSHAPSKHSSHHSHSHSHHHHHHNDNDDDDDDEATTVRDPHTYPLPPSRAATWAGSENGSFVSARSSLHHNHNHQSGHTSHDAPRTVIGRLTTRNLKNAGSGPGATVTMSNTKYHDFATVERGTESVVSKKKEVESLDVSSREVRPEDSVSQISVDSARSRRSRASRR